MPEGVIGPANFRVYPRMDKCVVMNVQEQSDEVRISLLTRDLIECKVVSRYYYSINDPPKSFLNVQNMKGSMNQLFACLLRDVIGRVYLEQVKHDREQIRKQLKILLTMVTLNW